ncbi:hypothetical protein PQU94_08715 [Asticcacaulis sp. DXS10W]|uniref:Uncharacterized protein n=1 Tax=Asticcacaulis currens TaxID=2984210 RepID=A0ABT5IEG4_9CAUL|nr:hypothetical protein [Asticcacaulis currens]MDC7694362.1 hypothetical protein [Asticcacaulis currens]
MPLSNPGMASVYFHPTFWSQPDVEDKLKGIPFDCLEAFLRDHFEMMNGALGQLLPEIARLEALATQCDEGLRDQIFEETRHLTDYARKLIELMAMLDSLGQTTA